MGVKVRRCLIVAGIGVLLVPAAVSAATTSKHVDAAAAARSCAQGRPLNARLRGIQVAYLARFVPCVLRAARTQLGLGYDGSSAASLQVRTALGRLAKLPYNQTHQLKLASKATYAASSHIAGTVCLRQGSRRATFNDAWVSILLRPGLTPLKLSKIITQPFANSRSVIRNPKTLFGVAARRGLLMENGALDGTDFGIVDFVCH
jgi:hypothetical protein